MSNSVIFIVDDEHAGEALKENGYISRIIPHLDNYEYLDQYEWVFCLPSDSSESVAQMIDIQKSLQDELSSEVIRLYPFYGVRVGVGSPLSSWINVEKNSEIFEQVIRSQIMALSEKKNMYTLKIGSGITLDSLYMKIVNEPWLNASYYHDVWFDERMFRTAFYAEIGYALMYMEKFRKIYISKSSMYIGVI